jgi:hypothetical protein
MNEASLTIHRNLPAMIAAYDESRSLIIDGFASINRARKVWNETFAIGDGQTVNLSIAPRRGSWHDITEPDEALKRLRIQTWTNIVDRIGLVNICSATRRKEMSEAIEKDELPEPTVKAVTNFLQTQLASLGTIFEEKVKAVFNKLRPCNSKYKRNSEEEVPRSVVLSNVVELAINGNYRPRISSYCSNAAELLDIESLFDTLEGRGHIAKSWKSKLQQAIEERAPGSNQGETEFFRFRCFKNGNLHLEFKRLDLLAKLNQIAGGNRLRKTKTNPADIAVA